MTQDDGKGAGIRMRPGLPAPDPRVRPATTFKILLIAGLRYPIAQPFVGGLESHTWSMARGLRDRGHSVMVVGARGSDPRVVDREFGVLPATGDGSRPDISNDPAVEAAEHAAFAGLLDDVRDGMLGSFDVVHNNSLHHLPVSDAPSLPVPMVTTLHTPRLPWAQRVLPAVGAAQDFIAVSAATAASWAPLIEPTVVHNGVDGRQWRFGPGGDRAVWSGRIAPEKAPHLAIDIARAAGIGLRLVGPVIDRDYFRQQVVPRLGGPVEYLGHLDRTALADLVRTSALALVTPVWEEPFGMVVAEAMSCGTPVLSLGRGGIPEIVGPAAGRLLAPADPAGFTVTELAAAVRAADECRSLDRAAVRRHAVAHVGIAAMLEGYERVYARVGLRWADR